VKNDAGVRHGDDSFDRAGCESPAHSTIAFYVLNSRN
jgi:hypothetical protein